MARETGYYFVKLKIGTFNHKANQMIVAGWRSYQRGMDKPQAGNWFISGSSQMPHYTDENMSYISPTPITPEKMQAIDEIVQVFNTKGITHNEFASVVNLILLKHGLL